MHSNKDHQYHDQRLPGTLAHLIAPFRQPQHLWEGTWVALCNGVFVLGLGILGWLAWDFKFQRNTDIVSWVTVHHYPKYQEIVAYIGAFFCVLTGVVSGLYCWCLLALIFQRWRNYSVSSSLRYAALSFSGYLAGAFFIILGRWNFISLFLIPMGLVLLTIVIFLFWPIPFLKPHHQPPSPYCAFSVSKLQACQSPPPGGSFWSYPGKSPRFLILVVISPSRYHQIAYVADARMQLELIRDLEKANPRLVIYSTGGWFDKPDDIPNSKRQWLVDQYIHTHFTKKVTIDNIVILGYPLHSSIYYILCL